MWKTRAVACEPSYLRYEVNVAMHHRLPGEDAAINANVDTPDGSVPCFEH
jgi:hypothetical protein